MLNVDRVSLATATALGVLGVVILIIDFDSNSPWFYVGLTQLLAAGHCVNASLSHRRGRTLDHEFEAGYRVGFRAGRRAAKLRVVDMDEERRRRGRVSKAPLWPLASDGALARREAPDPD